MAQQRGERYQICNQACPPRSPFPVMMTCSVLMTAVMIGVDPHEGSRTAVVIGPAEERLGGLRVRASAAQAAELVDWAAAWPSIGVG